jgi:hypothetical protein
LDTDLAVAADIHEAHQLAAQVRGWQERSAEAERLVGEWEARARTAEQVLQEWTRRAETAERLVGEWTARAREAERLVEEWRRQSAEARDYLHAVFGSLSWRVTRPLRVITRREKLRRER